MSVLCVWLQPFLFCLVMSCIITWLKTFYVCYGENAHRCVSVCVCLCTMWKPEVILQPHENARKGGTSFCFQFCLLSKFQASENSKVDLRPPHTLTHVFIDTQSLALDRTEVQEQHKLWVNCVELFWQLILSVNYKLCFPSGDMVWRIYLGDQAACCSCWFAWRNCVGLW